MQAARAQVFRPEQDRQQRDQQQQQVEHDGQAVAHVCAAKDLRRLRQQPDVRAVDVERADHGRGNHQHDDADRGDPRDAPVGSVPGEIRGDDEHREQGRARDGHERENRVGVELDHAALTLGDARGEAHGRCDA